MRNADAENEGEKCDGRKLELEMMVGEFSIMDITLLKNNFMKECIEQVSE